MYVYVLILTLLSMPASWDTENRHAIEKPVRSEVQYALSSMGEVRTRLERARQFYVPLGITIEKVEILEVERKTLIVRSVRP